MTQIKKQIYILLMPFNIIFKFKIFDFELNIINYLTWNKTKIING
jgi:hypothetical protein